MKIFGKNFENIYFKNEKNDIVKPQEVERKVNNSEDEIEFSVSGNELNSFFEMAKKEDENRVRKVEELKRQYENGEYKVSGREVILKILEGE